MRRDLNPIGIGPPLQETRGTPSAFRLLHPAPVYTSPWWATGVLEGVRGDHRGPEWAAVTR